MVQLSDEIIRILRREGADKTMVLGARLGELVRAEHEDLLLQAMEQQGVRFVQLVENIQEVSVIRDADSGLDVFIGLVGAAPPVSSGGVPSLRQDVYAAFTKVGRTYSYHRETDRFHEGTAVEGELECPEVNVIDLIEARRRFSSTLPDPVREELVSTLESPELALRRFRNAVSAKGLTSQWVRYLYGVLGENVRQWAMSSDVPVQASWFTRGKPATKRNSGTRQLLEDLTHAMTEEEARSILVPVSAVERYLSRLGISH